MVKIDYIGPFDSKSKLHIIGEVHGVSVGVEHLECAKDIPALLEMAKRYIESYAEYFGEFPPSVFNAEYGENNLSYLYQDWDNCVELYRIAVPFSGEQSEKVRDAQFIAGFRSLLEYRGECETAIGPATRRLLKLAASSEL